MDDFDNTPIQLWAAMAEAIKKIGNQELQRKKTDVTNLAMKSQFFFVFCRARVVANYFSMIAFCVLPCLRA